ncbi:hypothetical protein GCM10020000_67890 [Streptomyces olivoverticillatus]
MVTRLRSLGDAEKLIRAGIPVITSQSFLASELDGAGYGTAGHLMCVVGFTADGDVVANDPASPSDAAVERVYKRRQFENIWLRTKRHNVQGQVKSGSGGVCYLYFPVRPTARQVRALASVGGALTGLRRSARSFRARPPPRAAGPPRIAHTGPM